ncbi:uncharacterized protein PRCAT00000219001 [Priceomyces carsonii]|uniref:uncharacterized protein n=1 Tax=Priceomyces carsonii TaxID=28549 RepID=UPI002ED92E38|nr:unnamed protein product [Priceomyces carsonii]
MSNSPSNFEAVRYERLKKVCRKALEQLIKKSLSLEQIKMCYPTIASTPEGVKSLEIARSQVINFWHTKSLEEFEFIFKEREIESKLNELDEIIQTAQFRKQENFEKPVPVDSLSPNELIDSTVLVGKTNSVESLLMIYNQLCMDNEDLLKSLKSLADESEIIRNEVVELFSSLNKEVETLRSEDSNINFKELFESFMKVDK